MTTNQPNKEKHLTMRIENNLFNTVLMLSKERKQKTSEFIRYAIEKAIEKA